MLNIDATRRSKINQRNASRPRISNDLRQGIRAFVWEGLSNKDAATRAKMKTASFAKALRKPHVRALINQEFSELRSGAAFRAFLRMIWLSENARSEDVRYRANQWIADVDGLASIPKPRSVQDRMIQITGGQFHEPNTGTHDQNNVRKD